MPDWTWSPLLRPLVAAGGPGLGAGLLRLGSTVAGRPAGRAFVRGFAAIHPPGGPTLLGRPLASPVGAAVPVHGLAAMDALGFGVVVAGPVQRSGLTRAITAVRRQGRLAAIVLLHLTDPTPADVARVHEECAGIVDGIVVPDPVAFPAAPGGPVLVSFDGAAYRLPDGSFLAAGAVSPEEVARHLRAGASAVVADRRNLMVAGPGLAQRSAEAVAPPRTPPPATPFTLVPWRWPPWVWGIILAAGMVAGGFGAMLIALGPAMLGYDEAFVGLDVAAIDALNPRLRDFLRHDRITLAGTMLSIGVLYMALSLAGLRHRERWARRALLVSGGVGFASLFLFLGFGYFDPLHAAATAVLFPTFLLALRRPAVEHPYPAEVDPGPDSPLRRRALLAQFLLVGLAAGLLVGGAAIAVIGVGEVFVASDLRFLDTEATALTRASDRMLALVAHDRAGFGGALVSDALAVLLLALWAYRPGARWLWWTLLVSGGIGMGAAIGVHVAVGYTDALHLAPVLLASAALGTVLVLSRPYLLSNVPAELAEISTSDVGKEAGHG